MGFCKIQIFQFKRKPFLLNNVHVLFSPKLGSHWGASLNLSSFTNIIHEGVKLVGPSNIRHKNIRTALPPSPSVTLTVPTLVQLSRLSTQQRRLQTCQRKLQTHQRKLQTHQRILPTHKRLPTPKKLPPWTSNSWEETSN